MQRFGSSAERVTSQVDSSINLTRASLESFEKQELEEEKIVEVFIGIMKECYSMVQSGVVKLVEPEEEEEYIDMGSDQANKTNMTSCASELFGMKELGAKERVMATVVRKVGWGATVRLYKAVCGTCCLRISIANTKCAGWDDLGSVCKPVCWAMDYYDTYSPSDYQIAAYYFPTWVRDLPEWMRYWFM